MNNNVITSVDDPRIKERARAKACAVLGGSGVYQSMSLGDQKDVYISLVQDEIELVLQVNGKMRGALRVSASADKSAIEAAASATPEVARFGEGRVPKNVIVVPGRLVNVVV
jgi:leucyl-tRNA synthetase